MIQVGLEDGRDDPGNADSDCYKTDVPFAVFCVLALFRSFLLLSFFHFMLGKKGSA